MAKNQIFQYNGSPITFQIGSTLMVNATQMAKPFNKYPADWLKTDQSKEFISVFADMKNFISADLVIVTKGGNNKNNQGTWMHEDVALEFARWLSPAFAIWCNDRIKELLTTGSTAINNEPNNTAALREASEKIKNLTAQLEECRAELNYMRGRLESVKEIAVLEYRLSRAEKRQSKTENTIPATPINHYGPIKQDGSEINEVCPGAMLMREVSNRLKKEKHIYIGSSTLFNLFRSKGFLLETETSYNEPSQECLKNEWMIYTRRRGTTPEGVKYCTPYITPKGYEYFSELILKEGGAQ